MDCTMQTLPVEPQNCQPKYTVKTPHHHQRPRSARACSHRSGFWREVCRLHYHQVRRAVSRSPSGFLSSPQTGGDFILSAFFSPLRPPPRYVSTSRVQPYRAEDGASDGLPVVQTVAASSVSPAYFLLWHCPLVLEFQGDEMYRGNILVPGTSPCIALIPSFDNFFWFLLVVESLFSLFAAPSRMDG